MAKFATNASGAMLLPSLIQVTESISGSVVPLAMFVLVSQSIKCHHHHKSRNKAARLKYESMVKSELRAAKV